MSDQNHLGSDESGETSPSPGFQNAAFQCSSNLDTSQSGLERETSNQIPNDPMKYFNFKHMAIEQGRAMMALKMLEYEKALAERDDTISSLHTNMMNYKNNNHVLTNQYTNIMEKTKSVSDSCVHLNTSFTNICERLNRLGDTVDSARTRQKEVMSLVDQTTNTFQEKILYISDSIDDSLQKVNLEKIRAKQELENLENKYSFDLIDCKTNLEEFTKEVEILKSENVMLSEKLNETNIKLNEKKEILLNLNQQYEKELKDIKNQNLFLDDQSKSMSTEYDAILIENKSLKNELVIMKNSLDKLQLDVQMNKVEEQTKLKEFKISEELNDALKKDNFTLNERNTYLEKINTDLMNEINNNTMSINKVREEKEMEFQDMCTNYDGLLKMLEEKIIDQTEQLQLQKEKENKILNEVSDLKQQIEMFNNTIHNLQEEGKTNNILVPELQNRIDELNTDLTNTYQKLRDSSKEYMTNKSILLKEKNELELQNKEYFKQIEKLTANYMKYKSKAKQLYVEVKRLRYQCSRSEQKTSQFAQLLDTIEISDEEVDIEDDDVSIVEYIDINAPNINASTQSISSKTDKNVNYLKRNSTSLHAVGNSKRMKHRPDNSFATLEETNILKPINNVQKYESALNSSFRSINLKSDDTCYNKTEENVDNQDANENNVQNKINLTLSPLQREKSHVNKKLKSQAVNLSTDSISNDKKKFKIPSDMKPSQKKPKSTNKEKDVWLKPNSPVTLTASLPKQNRSKGASIK